MKAIDTLTKDDILPGITRLIGELKEHDVKLSVASASKNAPVILKKLGLFDKFDAIADPSKVEHGKPAPDIFLAGARVDAIKAANMTAVAVGDPEELGKADAVVPTTDDFSYALFEETWEKARN